MCTPIGAALVVRDFLVQVPAVVKPDAVLSCCVGDDIFDFCVRFLFRRLWYLKNSPWCTRRHAPVFLARTMIKIVGISFLPILVCLLVCFTVTAVNQICFQQMRWRDGYVKHQIRWRQRAPLVASRMKRHPYAEKKYGALQNSSRGFTTATRSKTKESGQRRWTTSWRMQQTHPGVELKVKTPKPNMYQTQCREGRPRR